MKNLIYSIMTICMFSSAVSAQYNIFFDKNDIPISLVENGQNFLIEKSLLPKVNFHSNGNFEIQFSKDKVAILGSHTIIKNRNEIKGKISEITCLDSSYNTECDANLGTLFKTYMLVWKIHPDKLKIGKPVIMIDSNGGTASPPFQNTNFWTSEQNSRKIKTSTVFSVNETKNIEPLTIQCSNSSWIKAVNEKITLDENQLSVNEWSLERMNSNPETNANENRTVMSHFGVVFDVIENKTLRLSNIRFPFISKDEFSSMLIASDTIGMNISNSQESCDVTFKFDIESFFQSFFPGDLKEKIFKDISLSERDYLLEKNKYRISSFYELNKLFDGPQTDFIRQLKILILLDILSSNYNSKTITVEGYDEFGDVKKRDFNFLVREPKRIVEE